MTNIPQGESDVFVTPSFDDQDKSDDLDGGVLDLLVGLDARTLVLILAVPSSVCRKLVEEDPEED